MKWLDEVGLKTSDNVVSIELTTDAEKDSTPGQPPVPPPPHRAPNPNSEPTRYTVSVRSLKPKQVSKHQSLVTPGVSLSPG